MGYSLEAAAPLVAFMLLGRRLRELMPEGHSLTEYVWHRYGWRANLFHQGYWQRVYAVRDLQTLRTAFVIAALVSIPIILAMGLFGLAAVGLGRADTPSVALFSVLLPAMPTWLGGGLVLLGLALVMSSADTLFNGIASIVAVDLHRALPRIPVAGLLQASRLSTVLLAISVLWIAAQGYGVLYLFLIADLVCAAAVFPVFYGLYSERYTGRIAICSTVAGLIAGGLLFPTVIRRVL